MLTNDKSYITHRNIVVVMYELCEEQLEYLRKEGFTKSKDGVYKRKRKGMPIMDYIDIRHGRINTYGYYIDGSNKNTRGVPNVVFRLKAIHANQSKLDSFGFATANTL